MHTTSPQRILDAVAPQIRRPRLRPDHPLLHRADGHLQLGLGARAIPIGPGSPGLVTWLRRIDGTLDWEQLAALAEAFDLDPTQAQRILHRIAACGGLDDAGSMPDSLRWRDRHDREAIEGDVAAAGIAYGSSVTANLVVERRLHARIAVAGSGALAEAVRTALAVSGMPRAGEDDADLCIRTVAHPALAEPDDRGPHLPVSVYGDAGEVGPIVIPGRTSCLRCGYLHRRDADPSWPLLVLQLEQAVTRMRPYPADRLLVQATATAAVLLVRRWADDPLAEEAWSGQVLEVHLPDAAIVRRPAPPHALCGCRWTDERTSEEARTGAWRRIG